MEPKKNSIDVQWVLDENLAYNNSSEWKDVDLNIIDVSEAGITRGTTDKTISHTLEEKYPQGHFIITANKSVDSKGDYFELSNKNAIVKFSKDINTTLDRKTYLKKFDKMLKNKKKVLGQTICLTRDCVLITKKQKTKIIKYKHYI